MDVDRAMGIFFGEEMIMNILSRIPVLSLLRFKCVSKFWMKLISEPYFTMKHLNRARNDENSQKILVSQWHTTYVDEFSLYCSSLSTVEDVTKLDCPSNGKPWRHTLCRCCDGMALMGIYTDKHFMLLLWNPSTRESIVLPHPKNLPKDFCTWGLGYDSTRDDYKILKIDHESPSEILVLKSGSWRITDNHPTGIHPRYISTDSLVFVHGAFHWLIVSSMQCYVISFSISDEVYREIPLPDQMCSIFSVLCERGVSVLGEMLCACTHYVAYTKDIFKFWVMKDYGVKESWTELFNIQGIDLKSVVPKYRFSDGEVLLCCRLLDYYSDIFKTSKEPFGLWPQSDVIQKGFVYTESLFFPKFN